VLSMFMCVIVNLSACETGYEKKTDSVQVCKTKERAQKSEIKFNNQFFIS
jgi:hypothetical protein